MSATSQDPSHSSDAASELARLRAAVVHEREQRARLELALKASGEGFWEWLPGPNKVYLSRSLAEQLGLATDGRFFPGETYISRIHPDDVQSVRKMLADLLRSGGNTSVVEHAFRIRDAGDRYCWTRVRATAEAATDGTVRRIAGMHADISDLKAVETTARDLEQRYRTLYELAPVALVMWSPRGHVLEWNRQAEQLFGWSGAQAQGERMAEKIVDAGDRDIYADMARRAVAEHRVIEAETDCLTRDGHKIRCRWWSLALREERKLGGLMTLALDITEKHHAEQQLELHRNNLETLVVQRTGELASAREALAQIIDKSPIPTFVLDQNHCVSHWNQACEKILGTPASWMIGTANHWQAFYPEPRPCLADLVMFNDHVTIDALYGGKVKPSPVVPEAFESEDYFPLLGRWLFFTAAPIRDAGGRIVGAIETLQDTSLRKQAEMALLEAKAEAEIAARAKAEFLANMSHEIRTPLNAILGFAHLLQKSELTARQAEHVARLRASGDLLLQLINDILDFSKIEAGRMPIEKAPFVLDAVLDNLAAMIGQRAREKGLELHFVLDNDVPQHLVGDSLRLTQVLINLISNAIKFTDRGQILLFISVAERQNDEVRLEIAVQDTGIGISPEQQSRLFHAFAQADSSTTRKYGGTGLGLTICERLVALMGGRISLSSEPGVGSTFLFDVPLGVGRETNAPAIRRESQRVLVVDDNAVARTVHSRLLEKLGYVVDVAASGEAALRSVAEAVDPYRMVFLDWNMPGMNGVEVARRLRSGTPRAPRVVIITSAGQEEAETAFADAEVNALILKPVSATSLAAALIGMESSRPTPAPEHGISSRKRLQGMRILLVDDVATNRLVAGEILADDGALIIEAEDGSAAVDKVLNGGLWDAVLMDVQMPVMNGLDATRAIRADPRFGDLPVFAMTAFALEEERDRCLAAGMSGFLTKPIDPEKLIATLAALPRRARGAEGETIAQTVDAAVPAAAPAPLSFPALPGIDTVEGLKRMMNKPAFYEKMLKSFHDRFVQSPATVRTLLAEGRIDDARREAHSAKGVSASVSANRLRDKALALEQAIAAGQEDVTKEIAAFGEALDEVLAGLRTKFGWTAPQ